MLDLNDYANGDAIGLIDLNEVETQSQKNIHDLDDIRYRLSSDTSWAIDLFPQGVLSSDKRSLRMADLWGRPPRYHGGGSAIIHLRGQLAGWGFDFAADDRAGPIDLIGRALGLVGAELFAEAARIAGADRPMPARRPEPPRPDSSLAIKQIIDGCQPVAGSVGATYLRSRGLADPGCPDLLYHPDLTHHDAKRGFPGLVAVPRMANGEPAGGIHRTFLADDGSAKAGTEKDKMMLGPLPIGSAVRLRPMGADGVLGIAEGIETALAAHRMFGVPVWAGLSAGHVRGWQWPEGCKRILICADAGTDGQRSAQELADRATVAGLEVLVVSALCGDDINDDLRKGVVKGDYFKAEKPAGAASAADADGTTHGTQDAGTGASAAMPRTFQELANAAEALQGGVKPEDMAALHRALVAVAAARLSDMEEAQLLKLIASRTKIPVKKIGSQVSSLRRGSQRDQDAQEIQERPRWMAKLKSDDSGNYERNEASAITVIENAPEFAGVIVFDEFKNKIVVRSPLPWDQGWTEPRQWSDNDDTRLAQWCQMRGVNITPAVVARAVMAVAADHKVHPVREYLTHIVWDGTPRIETWLSKYVGAKDTPINRAFGSRWLISAVARIMQPGCKADHMLVLQGPQGAGKSTAAKVLSGSEWFTDELPDLGSKDAAMQLNGAWIIEMAELDAFSRAETSRIKAFLTRTMDRYRPPYGRATVDIPRQCVFLGSCNNDTFTKDETGNRRIWPVRVSGSFDITGLARDRDQLWAEAVARHKVGAIWWLEEENLKAAAETEQEARYVGDEWDAIIDRWLVLEKVRINRGYACGYDDWVEQEVERAAPLTDISIGEVLEKAIGLPKDKWHRAEQNRVAAYLRSHKWERYRKRSGDSLEWRYRKVGWLEG